MSDETMTPEQYMQSSERLQSGLVQAKAIKGRALTAGEQAVMDKAKAENDIWIYFMSFGIQPETQSYIDHTIKLIEECDEFVDEVVALIRLDFSMNKLGLTYPEGILSERNEDLGKYAKEYER